MIEHIKIIKSQTRKLKALWTMEINDDLKCLYDENLFTEYLIAELLKEKMKKATIDFIKKEEFCV